MTTVHINLPDQLAQEAKQAGLLSEAALAKLLREQLQARRQNAFFTALERMEQTPEPPAMSPEDVAEEIRTMRAERRARAAG
ncbi:MAG TPA: hypothetical protein VN283_10145 [Thiobacillus sp.]|nr:hypothetical protein [Thiobacillus sp.]